MIPHETIRINPNYVPEQFRFLIPLAQVWGINDDGYRAQKIKAATSPEIEELKHQVLPVISRLFIEWLGDPSPIGTDAEGTYIAFIALTLAAEEA